MDGTRMSKKKNYIKALIEIDITRGYQLIREKRKTGGKRISLTAWVIRNIASTIAENPEVQALRKRNRLFVYKDVDVLLAVETKIEGESFPVVHVIRKANEKSALQLTHEIQELRKNSINEQKKAEWNKVKYFIRLPWFIRKIIYKRVLSSPPKFKKWMGTTAVTAVGMFGTASGWGISLPLHSLAFTLGGISEKPVLKDEIVHNHRFLHITINIDHDILDGAPAARFVNSLRKRLEK